VIELGEKIDAQLRSRELEELERYQIQVITEVDEPEQSLTMAACN
jgi:hypothetical protein